MVKIAVGDQVVITLDTKEKLMALKRTISIPKENSVSVSTERAKPSWLSVKMGTHVPRGFMAGTFSGLEEARHSITSGTLPSASR